MPSSRSARPCWPSRPSARSIRCCGGWCDSARELAGARYAALGIPDGQGAFAQFITDGMSDELIAAMGPLPRTHGLLGAMLESPDPYRTPDIRQDPRFRGWWPRAHPQMRSFLGVPIVARGEVIARVLPHRPRGRRRLRRRGPAADRDAGGARRGGDRERPAAGAQPRAEHRRGAQPARARAARLGQPEAVRPRAHRGGGRHAAGARRRGGRRADRAARRAGAGGARGAARADLRAAPGRRWSRRAWRRRCASRSTCCARVHGRDDRAADRGDRACGAGGARARCCGSPRRRSTTRCAMPTRSGSSCASSAATAGSSLTVADDGVGFDPAAPGRALTPARADLDGGARARARRHARGRLAARRRHDGDARGAAMIRVLIADDHAVVRAGPADVPRPAGRHRGGRRGGGRRGGAGARPRASRPTSC